MHCGGVHLSPPLLSLPAQLHLQLQYHLALQLFIHTSIHGLVLPGPVIKKSLVISFLNPPSPFLFPLPSTSWPLMPGYLRTFFMILLAAKTSNFVTMFIG